MKSLMDSNTGFTARAWEDKHCIRGEGMDLYAIQEAERSAWQHFLG